MKKFVNLDTERIQSTHFLIVAIALILSCIYLYHDSIHLYPSFIHAWTQSDRLALAMNFQQNSFDFFHPATFNLLTKNGITQVDFPIHDYLIAIISKLTNIDLIYCFRFYNLLYSLVGIYFIFKLSHLISASFWRSFLIAFFVFSLPFYAYYQTGFLPSVPSFANLFIGFYFFFKFLVSKHYKYYLLSISFILLAALARLPLLIFLVGITCYQVLKYWKNRKFIGKEIVPLLVAFAILTAYFLYNKHLADKYGSMFLQFFLPIKSFEHLVKVVSMIFHRWVGQIFGTYHALFFLVVLTMGCFFFKGQFKNRLHSILVILFLINVFGVLLFFIAMGVQFIDHDYYFIDVLLPLIVMLLIISLSSIQFTKISYIPFLVLSFLSCFYFINESRNVQEFRYSIPYNDQLNYSVDIYKKSAHKLDEWGVEKDDTLLILNAYSTNIPFTILNRKGYTLLNTSKDSIQVYLNKNFQYAVLIDSFRVKNILNNYRDIIYELDRVHSYKGLSLYKKSENKNEIDFFDKLIAKEEFDFETTIKNKNISANTKINYPNNHSSLSLEILAENEFNLSYKKVMNEVIPQKRLEVFVQADFLNREDSSSVNLVCQFGDFYDSRYLAVEIKDTSIWQEEYFHFIVPEEHVKKQMEFALYFWNSGKSKLYIDNYSFLIFQ